MCIRTTAILTKRTGFIFDFSKSVKLTSALADSIWPHRHSAHNGGATNSYIYSRRGFRHAFP